LITSALVFFFRIKTLKIVDIQKFKVWRNDKIKYENQNELIILDKESDILIKSNLNNNYCTVATNKSFELKIIKKHKKYCL
jgi:hypothetical protein